MLYLLDASITLPETVFGSGLNALGNLVKWIVEIVPNVGLGIILFTLILKIITLPLDIYSKSSMRKNSLKMEKCARSWKNCKSSTPTTNLRTTPK